MSYPVTSKDILSFLDILHPLPTQFDNLLESNELSNNDLKVDAKPFIPTTTKIEIESEEINHNVSMPKGFRKCIRYENCDKSNCGFLHEITWYKKDNHYLRILNDHQKEVDHILNYRIRTFPKLLSSYDEQCKYHQKMIAIAKHYAEINCNDVSYLSLDFNIRKPRRNIVDEHGPQNVKVDEYIPKNSKEEEQSYHPTEHKQSIHSKEQSYHPKEQDSVQNTNLFGSNETHPPKNQHRGVFRLNENRDRKEYNKSWRNQSNTR
jgi:hypothetical protein